MSETATVNLHLDEEKKMAAPEIPEPMGSQLMAQLMQSGNVAQNNFLTTTKAQDLDYLEGKRLVSLEEAMGVREVSSNDAMAGRPTGA